MDVDETVHGVTVMKLYMDCGETVRIHDKLIIVYCDRKRIQSGT